MTANRLCPGSYPVDSYGVLVGVMENEGYVEALETMRLVTAFRIALGEARVPREWIELLSGSREEAAIWKAHEYLK